MLGHRHCWSHLRPTASAACTRRITLQDALRYLPYRNDSLARKRPSNRLEKPDHSSQPMARKHTSSVGRRRHNCRFVLFEFCFLSFSECGDKGTRAKKGNVIAGKGSKADRLVGRKRGVCVIKAWIIGPHCILHLTRMRTNIHKHVSNMAGSQSTAWRLC